MLKQAGKVKKYIHVDSSSALLDFTDALYDLIRRGLEEGYKTLVFLCIGTDRSTGDSLGPLVGYKIGRFRYGNVRVYGNLDNPVHAGNLDLVVQEIKSRHDRPFIIAIDACLGRLENVGCLTVGEGSIKPGSGVNKDLEPVGDIHITGIVNFGGIMDFLILQNTRLALVMKMADIIAAGIGYVLWKTLNDRKKRCGASGDG